MSYPNYPGYPNYPASSDNPGQQAPYPLGQVKHKMFCITSESYLHFFLGKYYDNTMFINFCSLQRIPDTRLCHLYLQVLLILRIQAVNLPILVVNLPILVVNQRIRASNQHLGSVHSRNPVIRCPVLQESRRILFNSLVIRLEHIHLQ